MEKVDLLEARGGSYEPLEPPLRTPLERRGKEGGEGEGQHLTGGRGGRIQRANALVFINVSKCIN